jgi:myosin heavy subunit
VGASLEHYLLEKSRTVTSINDERNYHVFYYLYAGLTAEQRAELHLPEPSAHRYFSDLHPQLVDSEAADRWHELKVSTRNMAVAATWLWP